MNENKKNPENIEPEKDFSQVIEKYADKDSDIIISNTPDEDKEQDVPEEKKRKEKKEKNSRHPDKLAFFLGFFILLFAVVGISLTIWNSVEYIKETTDTGSEFAQYNQFLTPVAAVAPDTFDDISAADKTQLMNVALWSILSADTTPDTYSYSGGYMLIPASDVLSAYSAFFGPETSDSVQHATIQGYNYTFEYDKTADVYKIPITTIMPIYTPRVTDVQKSGTSLVVTVEYLAAESWIQDDEGNFIPPEPDKIMSITLRELQENYYIAAIQTVSSTVPETVAFENTTTSAPVSEQQTTASAEATTQQTPERTTLGGRVP